MYSVASGATPDCMRHRLPATLRPASRCVFLVVVVVTWTQDKDVAALTLPCRKDVLPVASRSTGVMCGPRVVTASHNPHRNAIDGLSLPRCAVYINKNIHSGTSRLCAKDPADTLTQLISCGGVGVQAWCCVANGRIFSGLLETLWPGAVCRCKPRSSAVAIDNMFLGARLWFAVRYAPARTASTEQRAPSKQCTTALRSCRLRKPEQKPPLRQIHVGCPGSLQKLPLYQALDPLLQVRPLTGQAAA
jgi:hypothetical protein